MSMRSGNAYEIEDRIVYLELKKMQINQTIKELKEELKVLRCEVSFKDIFVSLFRR